METLSLNGRWHFKQSTADTWQPASVPGCVHTDLLAIEAIPDPFYSDNESLVRWIERADWEYQRTFSVTADFLQHTQVLLHCAGLDTLATIWLNGTEIGRTDNAFRTWEFEVKALLNEGENELRVRFDSALLYGQARLAERYIHSWSTDTHKLPGGNYVRKSQCNFGWDWGPKLVTCGIWRDISLVALDTARLADVHVQQTHLLTGAVQVTCQVTAERLAESPLQARCQMHYQGQEVGTQVVNLAGTAATATFTIDHPQLWWPNGLGEQPLYTVTVTLLDAASQPLDEWQRRIGLRTLRLVRQPDEWGESFHFECNGVPFFAKGANWIPADVFVTRLTYDDYGRLLQAAADVHMNMLRVWGGGIYEQSDFYDWCDELGICVWQDFMYGCATYPTFDDDFMANVEIESRENIRRLRHHASLALWCGNNELEQGLVGEEWTNTTMSWADYSKLYDVLLADLCAELDPETSYWPGSPHTPHEDRYYFNDPRWGDAHIWDVWHALKPFEFYYTCFHRFNSEFGFQSFPEPQMVRSFAEPEDENVTSFVMEHHQRHPSGNSIIMHYMLAWFRLPSSFDMTLWLSQILQGMAIKHAVEHWRRTMPRGMGTLYWQLNDCWPVASWSSLDYDGRWKALHYMAKQFFAPTLVSAVPHPEDGSVAIHVTSDLLTEQAGVVQWMVTTAVGEEVARGEVTASADGSAVIGPNQNRPITTLDLQPLVAEHGTRNLLVWLKLLVDGAVVSENLAIFARPKHLLLPQPELAWEVAEGTNGRYEITISSDKPALWVWVEVQGPAQLSENFFHLGANGRKTVTLTVEGDADVTAVQNSLNVFSLYDTYQ
ncbi:MAG: glycoside hydrolase family 2 protein [Ardenticatenaceae bacterium]|nr:glycoside hydrolase family 2 protein [Ardenticatenaceae bacterium]